MSSEAWATVYSRHADLVSNGFFDVANGNNPVSIPPAGVIRLPNAAFRANAGADITTDILFLQKRIPDSSPGEDWLEPKTNVGLVFDE